MKTFRLDLWLTVSQTEDKLSIQRRCRIFEQMRIITGMQSSEPRITTKV